MGFDPATYTEAPTKQADVFSLEGLRDWLRTQNPIREYQYWSCGNCLAAQYLEAKGARGDRLLHEVFPDDSSYGKIAAKLPWSFGAALARCEAEIAKQ